MTIYQVLQAFHRIFFHVLYYTYTAFICLNASFSLILLVMRRKRFMHILIKMGFKNKKESCFLIKENKPPCPHQLYNWLYHLSPEVAGR